MTDRRAASRYAEALLDLAAERGEVARVRGELAQLVRLAQVAPELSLALTRPEVPLARRVELARAALEGAFSDLLVGLVCALVRHGRGEELASVAERFGELADARAGLLRAEALTAVPLTAQQRRRLAAALARMTGMRIELEARVDASVLAGVVVRVGDRLVDGSAAGRLARLRERLVGAQGSGR